MPVAPYVGQIMLFAGDRAPTGWLPCDGRSLEVATYPALARILGSRYGGDGVTTIRLPDLRGRTPMGAGDGPGLTPRRAGQRVGSDTLTLTAAQLPAHKHVATTTKRDQPVDAAGVSTPSAAPVAHNAYISSDAAIGNTGTARQVDITPPAVVMTWLIAVSGENPNPPRP